MGQGISTTIPSGRYPAYPVKAQTARYSAPLPPPQKTAVPPPNPISSTSAANGSRVIVFQSPARWRAYFESSKSSTKLVVIDFTAAWCGPCRLIEPFFKELAAKYTDVDFVKIDVDELMDVGRQFGIEAMPTFLFMKKGQEVERIVGVKKEELQKKVDKHRLHDNINHGYYY